MPDTRTHRGAHPEDKQLFAPEAWPTLRRATNDLCWLLGHGYATPSALKLVGDRYDLSRRQRTAVSRCACSDADARRRRQHRVEPEALGDGELWIDGYNVLTTLEAALGGGVILAARDGCYRDMASMHGSYRKVAETLPALVLVGQLTAAWRVGPLRWLLDSPVSNSGRLKSIIRELAEQSGWNWSVELAQDPDALLAAADYVVASADSAVIDRCSRWLNLARQIVSQRIPQANIVDLS